MNSLCVDDEQRQHLQRLVRLVKDKTLNGTEAWSAFSTPALSKIYHRNKVHWQTVNFLAAELKTYRGLRKKVQEKLFERCLGCCAYCRRPVGHYGWAWHIEHVIPKSKYPADTFNLANLTVGCVHCNMWKGRRVDDKLARKVLPIINPVEIGFNYSSHLKYVQVSTESLCYAKYSVQSDKGVETYKSLSFSELERAYTINGLHAPSAALHERITRAIGARLSDEEGQELVNLLGDLKSSIYLIP